MFSPIKYKLQKQLPCMARGEALKLGSLPTLPAQRPLSLFHTHPPLHTPPLGSQGPQCSLGAPEIRGMKPASAILHS